MAVTRETIEILVQAKNRATKTLKNVSKAYARGGSSARQFDNSMKQANKSSGNLNKALEGNQIQFQGWALSIMFAGMAIKRAFMGVWKSASKTFTEIQGSTEGSTDGFTKLQGSMKYLWFSVGQALEPLAESLIPIIDRISEWVQQNPKLTSGIVEWGIKVGVATTFIGGFSLAVVGVYNALLKLKSAIVLTIINFERLSMLGIGSFFSKIWSKIMLVVTALKVGLISSIKWIAANPIKTLTAAGILTGIFLAIRWIFKLKDAMGGWGEFFNNVARGVIKGFNLIIAKMIQAKRFVEQVKKGDSVDEASRVASMAYSREISLRNARMEEQLGTPERGYSEGASLKELMRGNVYGKQPIVIEMDGEKVGRLTSRRILREVNNSTRTTSE